MSDELVERLANYAHEAWSGWVKYQFEKGVINQDGTFTMPKWAVDRWQRQMNTPYAELPEEEKNSDRLEADKMVECFPTLSALRAENARLREIVKDLLSLVREDDNEWDSRRESFELRISIAKAALASTEDTHA
jgi:hypothetical protein